MNDFDRWLDELDELATEFRYRGMNPDKAEEAAIRVLTKRYPHCEISRKSYGSY